jgi:hypothetical protein
MLPVRAEFADWILDLIIPVFDKTGYIEKVLMLRG